MLRFLNYGYFLGCRPDLRGACSIVLAYQERRNRIVVGDRQCIVARSRIFRRYHVGGVREKFSGRLRAWRVDKQDAVLRSRLRDQLLRGIPVSPRALLRAMKGTARSAPENRCGGRQYVCLLSSKRIGQCCPRR